MTDFSSHEFSELKRAIEAKPSGYKLFGIVAGGIAAPVATGLAVLSIFLPRELDAVKSDVNSVVNQRADLIEKRIDSVDAAMLSADAKSEAIYSAIEALIIATARSDAVSVAYVWGAHTNDSVFEALLPRDVVATIKSESLLAEFSYSNFNGQHWVFIARDAYNKLDSKTQNSIEATFGRDKVKFYVE